MAFPIHTTRPRHARPGIEGSLSRVPGGHVFVKHPQETFLTDLSECGPNGRSFSTQVAPPMHVAENTYMGPGPAHQIDPDGLGRGPMFSTFPG